MLQQYKDTNDRDKISVMNTTYVSAGALLGRLSAADISEGKNNIRRARQVLRVADIVAEVWEQLQSPIEESAFTGGDANKAQMLQYMVENRLAVMLPGDDQLEMWAPLLDKLRPISIARSGLGLGEDGRWSLTDPPGVALDQSSYLFWMQCDGEKDCKEIVTYAASRSQDPHGWVRQFPALLRGLLANKAIYLDLK